MNQTTTSVLPIDRSEAIEGLEECGEALAHLVEAARDTGLAVPGLSWTVAQTAAHLVTETRALAGFVTGERDPNSDIPEESDPSAPSNVRVASINERLVAGYGLGKGPDLARDMREAVGELVTVIRDAPWTHRLQSWEGEMDVATATGVMLGEYLVHGLDIARALGRPWAIRRPHGVLAIAGAASLMPQYVNPSKAAGLSAVFELRLRGGPAFAVSFDDGVATVTSGRTRRADCRLSVDPVAYLLVGYGRISQWGPLLTGKILSWGCKPWLGVRFGEVFVSP